MYAYDVYLYGINLITTLHLLADSLSSTGDTFKAGAIYGILNYMVDKDIVSFDASTTATVCSHFLLALNPPKLEDIYSLIHTVPNIYLNIIDIILRRFYEKL